MTALPPLGALIGRGRAADVYALDAQRVLRRYREPFSVEGEAMVMDHARRQGFPAPEVFDAAGPDLVMQRLDGPTMLADLGRRPWLLRRHARCLAQLHGALHRLTAPASLPQLLGEGDALLHLDLHPDNVILTADGPVVIDWQAAARGLPAYDVAQTVVIMRTSIAPGSRTARVLTAAGRSLFVDLFLRGAGRPPADVLHTMATHRLHDPHLLPPERAAVERLRAQCRRAAHSGVIEDP